MMKKLFLRGLAMALTLLLTPFSPAAQAQGNGDVNIFLSDGADVASYVASIAGQGDTVYALEGDILKYYDAAQGALVPVDLSAADGMVPVDRLITGEDGLYGASDMRLYRILDASGKPEMRLILDYEVDNYAQDMFIQDGVFYVLYNTDSAVALKGFNLQTGEEARLLTLEDGIVEIAAYKGGKTLCVTGVGGETGWTYSLDTVDLETGKKETLTVLKERLDQIVYDFKTDTVVLGKRGVFYTLNSDNTLTTAAYSLSGDVMGIAVANGVGLMLVDNSIAVRNLTGDLGAQKVLNVREIYGRSENYKEFLTQNPQLSLNFVGEYNVTAEEDFIRDMTNRSGEVDIYLLTDQNLIKTIYDKAYGMDLSGSATLKSLADAMFTPFKTLFEREGVIYAFPKELFTTMLGYRSEFFEHFDLPLPTTYDELLDQAQLWLDEYSDEDANYAPFDNQIDVMHMLGRYVDECRGNQKELVFYTEEMVQRVERMMALTREYSNLERKYGAPYYAFNLIYVPNSTIYGNVPLAIETGNRFVISGVDMELEYYVINPFSDKQDEALAFLESVVNGWDPRTRVQFLSTASEPTESEYYQEKMESLLLEQADIEAALKENPSSEDLKSMLQQTQTAIVDIEQFRWEVSPESIVWYNSVVNDICISDLNPITVLQNSQPQLFEQFLGGSMDARTFLKTLDERVQIVFLEN